jgi:hypothetical protein
MVEMGPPFARRRALLSIGDFHSQGLGLANSFATRLVDGGALVFVPALV